MNNFFNVELIARLDPLLFWGIFISLTLFSFGFLVKFYKSILRARTLEDTPTSKIRSASQGYGEFQGKQVNLHGTPVIAPLSNCYCTWYKYQIFYYQDNNWRLLEQKSSERLFVLDDGTGICFIDPLGAEVSSPETNVWRGNSRYPKGLPKGFLPTLLSRKERYRYQEWRMVEGMSLYAIGNFLTFSKQHFTTKYPTRQVAEFIKRWKKSTHRLFTGNPTKTLTEKDIDNALNLAAQYMQKYSATKIQEPYFNILTNAGLGSRKPYVLSAFGQKKLILDYKIAAFVWFLVFTITTSFTAWFAAIRINF